MINYIFNNKTKNILAVVFTTLYIAINIYNNFIIVSNGRTLSSGEILNLLSSIIVLIYLLTLNLQYTFKKFLFPAAFVFKIIPLISTSIFSTVSYLKMMNSTEGMGPLIYSIVCTVVLLVAYVFCIIGSSFNFKKVSFLKIGMLILMVMCVVNLILQTFSLVMAILEFKSAQSGVSESILAEFVKSFVNSLISTIASLLFYFGLFNLTLNKSTENSQKKLFYKKEKQYENQFEDAYKTESSEN